MTAEKIREVVRTYRQMFGEFKVHPHKFHHNGTPLPADVLSHCHAMLDEIDQFAQEGRLEKGFRWLGFVQGCLWSTGVYSVEDMKEHNRP